jgi:hypothetical protein
VVVYVGVLAAAKSVTDAPLVNAISNK